MIPDTSTSKLICIQFNYKFSFKKARYLHLIFFYQSSLKIVAWKNHNRKTRRLHLFLSFKFMSKFVSKKQTRRLHLGHFESNQTLKKYKILKNVLPKKSKILCSILMKKNYSQNHWYFLHRMVNQLCINSQSQKFYYLETPQFLT